MNVSPYFFPHLPPSSAFSPHLPPSSAFADPLPIKPPRDPKADGGCGGAAPPLASAAEPGALAADVPFRALATVSTRVLRPARASLARAKLLDALKDLLLHAVSAALATPPPSHPTNQDRGATAASAAAAPASPAALLRLAAPKTALTTAPAASSAAEVRGALQQLFAAQDGAAPDWTALLAMQRLLARKVRLDCVLTADDH